MSPSIKVNLKRVQTIFPSKSRYKFSINNKIEKSLNKQDGNDREPSFWLGDRI